VRHCALVPLLECDQPVAGVDAIRTKPLQNRLIQHPLELAAMDAELRHVVAGLDATRLVPDRLTTSGH
jgi:hypothetical protein